MKVLLPISDPHFNSSFKLRELNFLDHLFIHGRLPFIREVEEGRDAVHQFRMKFLIGEFITLLTWSWTSIEPTVASFENYLGSFPVLVSSNSMRSREIRNLVLAVETSPSYLEEVVPFLHGYEALARFFQDRMIELCLQEGSKGWFEVVLQTKPVRLRLKGSWSRMYFQLPQSVDWTLRLIEHKESGGAQSLPDPSVQRWMVREFSLDKAATFIG